MSMPLHVVSCEDHNDCDNRFDRDNHLFQSWSVLLANHFAYECGFRRLPWMEKAFLGLLQKGMSYDLIMHLVGLTSRAPRPSWAYLNAIANNAMLHGAKTLDEFMLIPRPGSPSYNLPL